MCTCTLDWISDGLKTNLPKQSFSSHLSLFLSYLTVILGCHQTHFTLTTLAHSAGSGSNVEVKGHLRVRLTQSSSVSCDRKLAGWDERKIAGRRYPFVWVCVYVCVCKHFKTVKNKNSLQSLKLKKKKKLFLNNKVWATNEVCLWNVFINYGQFLIMFFLKIRWMNTIKKLMCKLANIHFSWWLQ